LLLKKKTILKPQDQKIYNELESLMTTQKLYLQSDLTLKKIADILGIKQWKLSEIISNTTQGNFYTYINTYRLEEFKKMLLNNEYTHLSLEGIAHEAGFGSKTTFYSFFKKTEGVTPKTYQKSLRQ